MHVHVHYISVFRFYKEDLPHLLIYLVYFSLIVTNRLLVLANVVNTPVHNLPTGNVFNHYINS